MRGRKLRLARTAICLLLCAALMPAVGANRTDVAQNQSLETVGLRISCDGALRPVRTAQTTVGATLEEAGIRVNPADLVCPSLNARVFDGMTIRVTRVVEKVIVKKEPVGFQIVRRPSRLLRPGQTRTLQTGTPGEVHKYYKTVYQGETLSSKQLLKEDVTVKPKDEIVLVGDRRLSSRGYYTSRRTLTMNASAYDPGPKSCGPHATGYTATGMKAGYGVVAVDPKTIPLGTKLYIDGYGFAIAGDVGRAIKGNRIDLCFETHEQAKRFGRKQVTVHILK